MKRALINALISASLSGSLDSPVLLDFFVNVAVVATMDRETEADGSACLRLLLSCATIAAGLRRRAMVNVQWMQPSAWTVEAVLNSRQASSNVFSAVSCPSMVKIISPTCNSMFSFFWWSSGRSRWFCSSALPTSMTKKNMRRRRFRLFFRMVVLVEESAMSLPLVVVALVAVVAMGTAVAIGISPLALAMVVSVVVTETIGASPVVGGAEGDSVVVASERFVVSSNDDNDDGCCSFEALSVPGPSFLAAGAI